MSEKQEETGIEKKKVEFKDVSVTYYDDPDKKHIMLPQGMNYQQAREWLSKIENEENRKMRFMHKFRGWFPFDAMWGVYRALAELFGFAHVADFKGMFGSKTPPLTISVEVDRGVHKQIPWGPIEVSGLTGQLHPNIDFDNGLPCLTVLADIKNSERPMADKLMKRAEEILRTSSIYRGKGFEVDFTVFKPNDMEFDVTKCPKFMDVNIREEDLIYGKNVQDQMETNLWTPIRNSEVCRQHKIPLRRGVLLAGKYGVGKTLAARVTAMICEKHGWTFIYLRNLEQLPQALRFARQYEPAVVFAEDINRVVSGNRNAEMDKMFNHIDGVDRKNDEVMVVFTTNDLDQIHAGMLRPGRIDAVVTVYPPDADAAIRLVRHYGRDLIDSEDNLEAVGHALAGQIPAVIREAVERSKLAAISATKVGERLIVKGEHLLIAAQQMLEHAKLLETPDPAKPDLVVFGETIGKILTHGVQGMIANHGVYDSDDLHNRGKLLDGRGRKLPTTRLSTAAALGIKEVLDAAGRPDPKNGAREEEA